MLTRMWSRPFSLAVLQCPSGITLVGRWHAPGSSYGWLLVEGDDIEAVAEHVSEWSSLAELSVTPVIDDTEASNALKKAHGK